MEVTHVNSELSVWN